jgi:hypothetical protein
MKVDFYHAVMKVVICSKFGIDQSKGFQSANRRKTAFPTVFLHRHVRYCLGLMRWHVIDLSAVMES